MRTYVIFVDVCCELHYFIVVGDYSHLDGLQLGSTDVECDQLEALNFEGEESEYANTGYTLEEWAKRLRLDQLDSSQIHVIECGQV